MNNEQRSNIEHLRHNGVSLIACGGAKGKTPVDPNTNKALNAWQEYELDINDLNGHNLGAILGERSSGLVDFDLDWHKAREVAFELQQEDVMPIGPSYGRVRDKKPILGHVWMRCPELPQTVTHDAPITKQELPPGEDSRRIVELRGPGGQSVCPISVIQPGSEQVAWRDDIALTEIPAVTLGQGKALLNNIAGLAFLAAMWPQLEGSRHEIALTVAGAFCHGMPLPKAKKLLIVLARCIDDEEKLDRARAFVDTTNKFEAGEAVSGVPRLGEIMPEPWIAFLKKTLGLAGGGLQGFTVGGKTMSEKLAQHEADAAKLPDPEPLPDQLPSVPLFDPRCLPDKLAPWVVDNAERMGCPPEFIAAPAMSVAGSLIGTQVTIWPKRFDDWTVAPVLWSMIINLPGRMKSPAIHVALQTLARLEAEARDEHEEMLATWALLDEQHKLDKKVAYKTYTLAKKNSDGVKLEAIEAPEKPVRRRYLTNDATGEKIGEILGENPNGIFMFRDELAGWFETLRKPGREGERQFYLEAWSGMGRYTYDRIQRGTIEIENMFLTVSGTIQPGPLGRHLREIERGGGGDDGLLQRFQLAVWPDDPTAQPLVDRKPDEAAAQTVRYALEALVELPKDKIAAEQNPTGRPYLRFSPDAQPRFLRWLKALEKTITTQSSSAMANHLSKFRSLVPGLALVTHLVDGGRGPVPLAALRKAVRWARYLRGHAQRIYHAQTARELGAAHALLRRLDKLPSRFSARDVKQREWGFGLREDEIVDKALDMLVEHYYLQKHEPEKSLLGGRPTIRYERRPTNNPSKPSKPNPEMSGAKI